MQAVQNLIAIANALNAVSNNPATSGTATQDALQLLLDQAVQDFQTEVDPTLNPDAITPTTSP